MLQGTGSLKAVINQAKILNHKTVFAKDQNGNGIKAYGSSTNWEEFFKKYDNCLSKHFYEVIQSNLPMVLYLDMEHYGEEIFDTIASATEENIDALDRKVIQSVTFFLQKFLLQIGRSDLVDSSNASLVGSCSALSATHIARLKTSCHVVFHDLVFSCASELAHFMNLFADFIQNFEPENEDETSKRALLFYHDKKADRIKIVIDPLVYHKNPESTQLLRLMLSSKFSDKNSALRYLLFDNGVQHISQKELFLNSLAQPDISKEKLNKAIQMTSSSPYPVWKPQATKKAANNASSEIKTESLALQEVIDLIAPLLQKKLNLNIASIDVNRSNPNFIYINNRGMPRSCPWANGGFHTNNNAFITIENEKQFLRCFGSECKDKKIDLELIPDKIDFHQNNQNDKLQNDIHDVTDFAEYENENNDDYDYYDNDDNDDNGDNNDNDFDDISDSDDVNRTFDQIASTKVAHPLQTKEEEFKKLVTYKRVEGEYLKRDLSHHLQENERFQLIRSPTGTGKTKYMQKAFEDMIASNPLWVYIAVSPRCSVTQQHFKEFQSLGFVHYADDKNNLESCTKIITTLDSITKINQRIDVIYIDEVESLLEHVFSDTLNQKRLYVWKRLLQICNQATRVICTDADFGDVSMTFFTNIFEAIKKAESQQVPHTLAWESQSLQDLQMQPKSNNFKALFLDNVRPLKSLRIKFCRNVKQWTDKLESALKIPRSKIFIGCDSKKSACNLHAQINAWLLTQPNPSFTKDQILLYTSEDGDKSDFNNVNSIWAAAKVVLCSPTIVYGVDYSNQDHPFTSVFGFYKQQGRTLGAEKIRQQLRRCRFIERLEGEIFHIIIFILSTRLPTKDDETFKKMFPITAPLVRERLRQISADYKSEIEKIIPVSVDGTGNVTLLDNDPLTELYIEFIRKRNISKFDLSETLHQLLKFEKHLVTLAPFQKALTKEEKNQPNLTFGTLKSF